MFGTTDPELAISQLEAYHREGRGERAEVMASALVDQLISQKSRDDKTQGLLVKGLRILAAVLNSRAKYKRARITIALVHKHRNKHGKAVGGGDDDDTVVRGVDAIHACQQLVQRLLRLRVVAQRETLAPRLAVASSRVKVRVKVGVKVRVKVRGEGGGGGSL